MAPKTLPLLDKRVPATTAHDPLTLQDLIAAAKKSLENLQNFLGAEAPRHMAPAPATATTENTKAPPLWSAEHPKYKRTQNGAKTEKRRDDSHPFDPKRCLFVFPPPAAEDVKKTPDSTPKFPDLNSPKILDKAALEPHEAAATNGEVLKPIALFRSPVALCTFECEHEENTAPAILIPDDLAPFADDDVGDDDENPELLCEEKRKKSRSRIYFAKRARKTREPAVAAKVVLPEANLDESSFQTPPSKPQLKELENKQDKEPKENVKPAAWGIKKILNTN